MSHYYFWPYLIYRIIILIKIIVINYNAKNLITIKNINEDTISNIYYRITKLAVTIKL